MKACGNWKWLMLIISASLLRSSARSVNSTVAYFTFKMSIPWGFRVRKRGDPKSWPGYLVKSYDITCTDQVDFRSPVEKLTFVDKNYSKLGNIKAICSDRLFRIFIYLVLDSSFIGLFSVFSFVFNADPLLAFRHLVYTAMLSVSGCEP